MEFALLHLHSINYSFKNFEKMLLQIVIRWDKDFSKMYNLLHIAQFFCTFFSTRFRNEYLDFYKFATFLQIIESKGFPETYQML